ncbi:MAG: ribosome small subunit-dependent GTPase A [Burkholderiaceae bacterium]
MPSATAQRTELEAARIVAGFGRQYAIRMLSDGADHLAVTRGKRTDACVGDIVDVRVLGSSQAVIESIRPRRTLLMRSDRFRHKLLAANVDRAAIVIAGEPRFAEDLLLRMLIAIEAADIEVLIVANKTDREIAHRAIAPRLDVLRAVGYPVVEIAVGPAPEASVAMLRPWLGDRTTILLGQSGMGKSSLLNALVPDAEQATQAISEALGTGRHTTTFTRLFDLQPSVAPQAHLIDSPGFQTFGLAHLSASQRVHAMPEFRARLGQCRFLSCTHRHEPGCAIRAAVDAGEIDALRYRLFTELIDRD